MTSTSEQPGSGHGSQLGSHQVGSPSLANRSALGDIGKVVRINSATLIQGATGTGKSSLIATLAEYVWLQFGLILRLITTDGGGFPNRVEALIRRGIIQIWRARTRDLPDGSLSFETCLRAAQGWWPQRINPRTGECQPGERLVPPITERYDMACPNGHPVKSVPFQSLLTPALCPTCRTHTTKENMRVTKSAHRTKGFEQVGAQAFDGLTSMLSWMMSDMGQRSGRLELKGEEGAIGGKIVSGDLKLGGNSRSHYGFAQNRAEELVLNSLSIPYLVVPPIFTALTLETTDEGGLSVRGPKLAGKAKTDEAAQWFGNALESAVVKDDRDQQQFRLYLSEFVDEAGVRHLCKHRGAPGTMPPYLEDPPITAAGTVADTAFTQFNLGVFLELMEAGLTQTLATVDQRYPNAPGVPDGFVEVGEGTAVVQAGAQTSGQVQTGQPAQETPAAPVAPAAPTTAPKARTAAPTAKPPVARRAGPMAVPASVPPAAAVPEPEPAPKPVAEADLQAGFDQAFAQQQATEPAAEPAVTQPEPEPAPVAPVVAAAPTPAPSVAPQARRWAPPSAPRPPAVAPRIRPTPAPTQPVQPK